MNKSLESFLFGKFTSSTNRLRVCFQRIWFSPSTSFNREAPSFPRSSTIPPYEHQTNVSLWVAVHWWFEVFRGLITLLTLSMNTSNVLEDTRVKYTSPNRSAGRVLSSFNSNPITAPAAGQCQPQTIDRLQIKHRHWVLKGQLTPKLNCAGNLLDDSHNASQLWESQKHIQN